jgi:hypothetical protein
MCSSSHSWIASVNSERNWKQSMCVQGYKCCVHWDCLNMCMKTLNLWTSHSKSYLLSHKSYYVSIFCDPMLSQAHWFVRTLLKVSSSCLITMIRMWHLTILLIYGNIAPLKKLRNLNLSLWSGPLQFWVDWGAWTHRSWHVHVWGC